MAVEDGSVAVEDVDVAVTVLIPQIGALGALDDDGIDDLLELRVEAGDDAAVGKNGAMLLSEIL